MVLLSFFLNRKTLTSQEQAKVLPWTEWYMIEDSFKTRDRPFGAVIMRIFFIQMVNC